MTRGVVLLASLVLGTGSSARPLPPPPKVSCVLRNHEEVLYHHAQEGKEAYSETIDDWYVDCHIDVDGKQVWSQALPLAHPTDFHSAMLAVDEFRKKRAAEILKEMKK